MPQGTGQFGALYEPKSAGTELAVIRDKFIYTKAADQASLDIITDLQGLPDLTRTALAVGQTLAEYDQNLEDQEFVLRDRLDYYDYDTVVKNRTVADGAWFSPNVVNAGTLCGEEVGNEASKAIDGNSVTFWRHSVNEQHVIVFKLRDYPKKIEKIRFLYGSNESARERLNNMDVHAAKGLANLDNAENILETGINIAWPVGISVDTWVEHTLASKKLKARYIKLVIDDTDNGQNQIQIREFEVFVTTRKPEDTDTE